MHVLFGIVLLSFAIGCTSEKHQAEVVFSGTSCSQGNSLLLEFEDSECSQISNAGAFQGRLPSGIQKIYLRITISNMTNATVDVFIPLLSDTKCDNSPQLTADLVSGTCKEIVVLPTVTIYLEIQNISIVTDSVAPVPSGEIVTEGFVASNVGFEDGFFNTSKCGAATSNITVPQAEYCYKPASSAYHYKLNCYLPKAGDTVGKLAYTVSNNSDCSVQTEFQGLPVSFPTSVPVSPGECRDEYINMTLDTGSSLSVLEPVRVWSGDCTPQINCTRLVACGNASNTSATALQLSSCNLNNQTAYCLLPIKPQYCGWKVNTNSSGKCSKEYRPMTTTEITLCDLSPGSYCIPNHAAPSTPSPGSPDEPPASPSSDDDSNIVPIVVAISVVFVLFIGILITCRYLNKKNAENNSNGLEINMVNEVHAE